MVSWHKHIEPHIRMSCSGIKRGLFLRRPISATVAVTPILCYYMTDESLLSAPIIISCGNIYFPVRSTRRSVRFPHPHHAPCSHHLILARNKANTLCGGRTLQCTQITQCLHEMRTSVDLDGRRRRRERSRERVRDSKQRKANKRIIVSFKWWSS